MASSVTWRMGTWTYGRTYGWMVLVQQRWLVGCVLDSLLQQAIHLSIHASRTACMFVSK